MARGQIWQNFPKLPRYGIFPLLKFLRLLCPIWDLPDCHFFSFMLAFVLLKWRSCKPQENTVWEYRGSTSLCFLRNSRLGEWRFYDPTDEDGKVLYWCSMDIDDPFECLWIAGSGSGESGASTLPSRDDEARNNQVERKQCQGKQISPPLN